MAEVNKIFWLGKSGRTYLYKIYEVGTLFESVPGNFVFARAITPHRWIPVYIGETSRMNERFEMRKQWWCIIRYNATHIHVHSGDPDDEKRFAEVSDLLAGYKTPCNA